MQTFCLNRNKRKLSDLIQSRCYLRSQNHCWYCYQSPRSCCCCCCHSVGLVQYQTQHCFQLKDKKEEFRTLQSVFTYKTRNHLSRPVLPLVFYHFPVSLAVDFKSLQKRDIYQQQASYINEIKLRSCNHTTCNSRLQPLLSQFKQNFPQKFSCWEVCFCLLPLPNLHTEAR